MSHTFFSSDTRLGKNTQIGMMSRQTTLGTKIALWVPSSFCCPELFISHAWTYGLTQILGMQAEHSQAYMSGNCIGDNRSAEAFGLRYWERSQSILKHINIVMMSGSGKMMSDNCARIVDNSLLRYTTLKDTQRTHSIVPLYRP